VWFSVCEEWTTKASILRNRNMPSNGWNPHLRRLAPACISIDTSSKRTGPKYHSPTTTIPVVEATIEQRRKFFEHKSASLYRIEIFYVVLLEGSRSKCGMGAALGRILSDPHGGLQDYRRSSSAENEILLRSQIESDITRLQQRIQAFIRRLPDFTEIKLLPQQAQFTFFRRLLNF
jgi:hypothetical protein